VSVEIARAKAPELLPEAVLAVNGLRVERIAGAQTTTVVSSMSLTVGHGETIGIVGESGSGKSITARAITGLLPPGFSAHGDVRYGGRNLLDLRERDWRQIRGREIGLIMQDPFTMLNPVMRCGRILHESVPERSRPKHRRWREDAARRLNEVGIEDPSVVDLYPFQLSGGMRQRVAIAAVLARDPHVLIADEPSTALDVATQRDILALIKRIQADHGMSLILITHDLRVAFAMCDRIFVLYAGALLEVGPASEFANEPLHPYSHGLLMSEPPLEHRLAEMPAIPGSVPAADEVAGRCPFAARCRWAQPVCDRPPALAEVAPGRRSACVRIDEIRVEMAALRGRQAPAPAQMIPARLGDPLLHIGSVTKVFRDGRRSVCALDDVSLQVGRDESVALVGESGSGKTTLSRLVMGLEQTTRGEIVIDGIRAGARGRLGVDDRRRLQRTVQMVFQDPYSTLNPMRSIGYTLAEALTVHQPRRRRVEREVTELLESVGLPGTYAQRRPAALSGGERQRVAIARALATEPRLLICDEPVSALDVSIQAQILNLFGALRRERGLSYLFITHDLSIVRQVADYVYVINRGRIVESAATDKVMDAPEDPYTVQLLAAVPRGNEEWLGVGE